MDRKDILPTGALPIDRFLEGGLHIGEITTVFGEAATGKSTLAYQSLINVAKMGLSTIFIDPEHKFNTRRIAQIDSKTDLSDCIVVFQPKTFDQQIQYLKNLNDLFNCKSALHDLFSSLKVNLNMIAFISNGPAFGRRSS